MLVVWFCCSCVTTVANMLSKYLCRDIVGLCRDISVSFLGIGFVATFMLGFPFDLLS